MQVLQGTGVFYERGFGATEWAEHMIYFWYHLLGRITVLLLCEQNFPQVLLYQAKDPVIPGSMVFSY